MVLHGGGKQVRGDEYTLYTSVAAVHLKVGVPCSQVLSDEPVCGVVGQAQKGNTIDALTRPKLNGLCHLELRQKIKLDLKSNCHLTKL